MSITSGFFNSVDGDRLYNADQMSTYFKGSIGQGVYNTVGGAMQVVAANNFSVDVKTGRAIVGDVLKWIENDAVYNLTITPAHVTLNRYTAVVIQCDMSNRDITITTKDGSYATNPTKPAINDVAGIKELCLAYIYVRAGATTITQSVIQDTRSDNNVCGWVTGLIEQIDTTDLFDQWVAAYEENIAEMNAWEQQMQSAFNSWFSTLTQRLSVNTYIQDFTKIVTLNSGASRTITLDMTDYEQSADDIFLVFINGLKAVHNVDYTIGTGSVTVNCHGSNDVVEIKVLKSKIGFYYLSDSEGNVFATDQGYVLTI